MNKDSRIFIVGHNDIIEKSLVDYFQTNGYKNVISSSSIALNATIQSSVYELFSKEKPEYVFLGSTRSGGIKANQDNSAEYIYHNLESQNNIIYASDKFGVKKLLYFASSCVYPKECPQPMKEEYILSGKMEETSESYSIAKAAGIKLCQAFRKQHNLNAIIMIPATVYGPGDNINIETSHVVGALIGKFSDAIKSVKKEVNVWGTGKPKREFLYVDDFIEATLFLMNEYNSDEVINVGSGYDVTIEELAQIISQISGFEGETYFDASKPDGVSQKLLDSCRINKLGWKPKVTLEEGLEKAYRYYEDNYISIK